MSFNLNRAENDLQITANQVKFTSDNYTSNIIIDLSNANTTMFNMNPNSANFVGFMANASGLYMKSNVNATSFEPIGGSGVSFTPNIALELVSGNKLNVLYNPTILSIDASNRLNIANSAITNSKLANTGIQFGNVNVALGNAITSIYAGNIFGRLSSTNLPLSFDNVAMSNINFTSGSINNVTIGTSTANSAVFNNILANNFANITGNLNIGSSTKYAMITNNTAANTLLLLSTSGTSNLSLISNTNSHLFFGPSNNIGLRLLGTGGNLEVSSNSAGNWARLYTLGDLVAGNGLVKSGANNNTLDVQVDNSTLTILSDILSVKDSGISATQLASNAVTTVKIADSNVTTSKIADSNITAGKLASNAVTTVKIADSNVTTSKIADSNITAGKLADNAVITIKIADSNVTTSKIADSNITAGKLADNAVITIKIADSNVTTSKIADSNITSGKLADNSVITIKIADSNVTTSKIADSNITTIKIADSNITTNKLADYAVTTIKIADSNITTGKLVDAAVTNSKIANSTVTIGGQTLALGGSLDTVSNWTVTNFFTTNNGNVQGTLNFGNLDHHITFNSGTDKIDIHGDVGIMNTLTVSNSVTIGGNLFVTGNTYFVNSNVTTITDPVFYLGSNTVPSDLIDRGIAFRYQSNSVPKLGFMGFQQETQDFVYIPDASESPENNFIGTNGTAHFGDVKVDSNLVVLSNGYLIFGGVGSQVGLRYNSSNLEVRHDSADSWNKLYTLSDLVAGNGIVKSGLNNNTIDIQVDNSTLEINSDTLRVKNSGITNAQLGNSVITIDGQTLALGSSYANLALSLSNASNYSAANLVGTIKNSQLGNSVITIDGQTLALGSSYANLALSLSNASNYSAANLVGTLTNSQLGNSVITIDGQTLALGSSYANLALSLSNASNYSAANLVGTLMNSQLANSSIIIDGQTLALGSSYANLALSLSNASNYSAANLVGTLTNSQLGNSVITIDGQTLALGSSYANLALSLSNASNYSAANLVGTIKNSQLANSVITIDGQTLALGSSYSNLALSLSNASNYSAANLVGTLRNSQLANSSIIISGTTYTLGSIYSNITLDAANAIVFRAEANTFIRSGTASNIDISGTGNVNITANTDILLTTVNGGNVKIRGPTGSNQFAVVQSTNGNVYLNIGQTTGDNGYGIRSNTSGGLEFKNSGGNWTGFGTGSGGGGTPGGANTQIQFNDSSAFGGSANFTFNKATGNVALTGNVNVSALSSATHIQASNTFTISQFTSGLSNLSGTQTVTLDFNQGSNFLITLAAGANITLANPTNISRLGQQGVIIFKTPSSGTSHVLNWYRGADSSWYFPDIISPPQISAGQNIYDVFNFMVVDTSSNGRVLVTDATGFQQFV